MNHEDRQNEQIHENLQILAKRCSRPRDARPEQIRRWVRLAEKPRRARILRFAGIFRRHPIAGWLSSGVAAAILAFVVLGGMGFLSQSISADEIFAQVGNTVSRSSAVSFIVKDVVHSGHEINMRLFNVDRGGAMYGELEAKPHGQASGSRVEVNMTTVLKGRNGWVLVRRFRLDGCDLFGELIPENGGILVPLSVSSGTRRAVRNRLPIAINLINVQALIESLRKAVPELTTRKHPNGLVTLEGVITKPELLDSRSLRNAIDITNTPGKMIPLRTDNPGKQARINAIAAIAKTALEGRLEGKELELAKERIDLLVAITTDRNRLAAGEKTAKRRPGQKRNVNAMVQKLIAGSLVKITYNPETKLLREVHLTNVGPAGGSISIRFNGSHFNRNLLNSDRFKADPKVLSMTKAEFMQAALLPLLMPTTLPAETESPVK